MHSTAPSRQPKNKTYAIQRVRPGLYRLMRRRTDGAWERDGDYLTAAAARRASEPTPE